MKYSEVGNGLLDYENPWGCGHVSEETWRNAVRGIRRMTSPEELSSRETL